MARIAGVDLPRRKRIEIGLTYIYGIGLSTSKEILQKLNIDPNTSTDDLSEAEINNIRKVIDSELKVEGELRTEVSMNIKRLMDLGCYRGLRHRRSLPVHGQRTKTNARTRKGPKRTSGLAGAEHAGDLGQDGHGDLGGGPRADGQPDRAVDARDGGLDIGLVRVGAHQHVDRIADDVDAEEHDDGHQEHDEKASPDRQVGCRSHRQTDGAESTVRFERERDETSAVKLGLERIAAPAAVDLRLIVAIIKTITDLERIGDEAEKIGFLASKLAAMDRPSDSYRELKTLGQHVAHMVRDAMNAFARLDVEEAWDVVREDERVDEEYEAIQRQCITFMMEDPRSIKRFMNVTWVARSLERIGDHAKNICEYVIYMVQGKDVRHTVLSEDDLPAEDEAQ